MSNTELGLLGSKELVEVRSSASPLLRHLVYVIGAGVVMPEVTTGFVELGHERLPYQRSRRYYFVHDITEAIPASQIYETEKEALHEQQTRQG